MDNFKDFDKFQKDQEKLAMTLADSLGMDYYDLQVNKPSVEALKVVDEEVALKLKVIPIKKDLNTIILGVVDPFNPEVETLKQKLENEGLKVSLAIISNQSFDIAKDDYKFISRRKISYAKVFEVNTDIINDVNQNIDNREDLQKVMLRTLEESPFFLLDYVLAGALKFNASDIHFEPYEKKAIIRYRLDGLLYDVCELSQTAYDLIKNRIKVLSGLMINVTNKPQDGSFSLTVINKKIDIRVSIIPVGINEAIVLRVLDFSQIKVNLEDLGFREDDLEFLNEAIAAPNGLILNTGPTGSGKTTTLYSILMKIKDPTIKIVTVENPIEYKIEGISQTQVDETKGLTFASALRAFLRHDPDVILVGEIRDKETADTAIQAALTGHLVLSTLHTNDTLGAIPRLFSLGVDVKLIPSALRLIIAQRLLRQICSNCKEEYSADEDLIKKIKAKLIDLPKRVKTSFNFDYTNLKLAKGKGCDKCFNTGYKGRIGIFEFLRMSKALEELIYQKPSEAEILKAIKDDFVSLQQDALIKALEHKTTIEEVERITGLI